MKNNHINLLIQDDLVSERNVQMNDDYNTKVGACEAPWNQSPKTPMESIENELEQLNVRVMEINKAKNIVKLKKLTEADLKTLAVIFRYL